MEDTRPEVLLLTLPHPVEEIHTEDTKGDSVDRLMADMVSLSEEETRDSSLELPSPVDTPKDTPSNLSVDNRMVPLTPPPLVDMLITVMDTPRVDRSAATMETTSSMATERRSTHRDTPNRSANTCR